MNLTGRKFGSLTVLHYAGRFANKYSLWHCACDCGGTSDVVTTSLVKGWTVTCTKCPPPTDRPCNKCGTVYPFTAAHFLRDGQFGSGLRPVCRPCYNGEMKVANRKAARKLRMEILVAYGSRCACCGEATEEFLALDHVHGGGHQERKRHHGHIYAKARREGFPPTYRLLCHNCNVSQGKYGYCPHQGTI
jgi:hypothetical protein